MTLVGQSITGFAQGDNFSVTRTILSVPASDTLAKMWFTVKKNLTDADPGIFQKVITTTFVVGQGQITAAGNPGTARFDVQQADSVLIVSPGIYLYDIKALTAAGLIAVLEEGTISSFPRVTLTLS